MPRLSHWLGRRNRYVRSLMHHKLVLVDKRFMGLQHLVCADTMRNRLGIVVRLRRLEQHLLLY